VSADAINRPQEMSDSHGATEAAAEVTRAGNQPCGKAHPEILRMLAKTDPHSPPEWRVNGPLANLVPFQKAFGCQAGQPMVRSPRCEVW
jgi:putative endopeptidase